MADIHDRNEQYENHLSDDSDSLDTLKRQMELRGAELGKTWSELSKIMTRYQSQLIQKHDNYKSTLNSDELTRISKIEALVEKKSLQIQKLEKANSDLETRLLEKDSEIVRLRTEVHQSRNEVSMKDSLIEKLQTQMAKEAIEYQTELNSLREMLQMNSSCGSEVPQPAETGAKRRRLAPVVAKQSSTTSIKQETSLQPSLRHTQSAFTSKPDSLASQDTVLVEVESYSTPDAGDESYYKLDDAGDESFQSDDLSRTDDTEQGLLLDTGQDLSQARLGDVYVDYQVRAPPTCGLWIQQQLRRMDYRPHQCTECDKKFRRAEHLKIHQRIHTGDMPFRCSVCDARFRVKWNCTTHIRTKHGFYIDSNKYIIIDTPAVK